MGAAHVERSDKVFPACRCRECLIDFHEMRTALNIGLGLLLFLVAGCGSIDSHWEGNHKAFVGTRYDADQLAHYSQDSDFVAALDMPLSFVVDTLFLPYDLAVGESEPPKGTASVPPASEDPRDKEPKEALKKARASR